MDRAIKKTIHQRVGIHPGLFLPVMDLINFLLIDPAPAAPVYRKPGTIIMGRSFPGMTERNIKIRKMVKEICKVYKFIDEEELYTLAIKQKTRSNDIQKFILKTEFEIFIKKQNLVLTYAQEKRLESLYRPPFTPERYNKLYKYVIILSIDHISIKNSYSTTRKNTLLEILEDGMSQDRYVMEDIWTRIRTQVLTWEIEKIPDTQRKEQLFRMFQPNNTEIMLDDIEQAIKSPLSIVPSPKYYAVVAPPAPPLEQAATTSPPAPLKFPDVQVSPLPTAPARSPGRSPSSLKSTVVAPSPAPPSAQAAVTPSPTAPFTFPNVPTAPLPTPPAPSPARSPGRSLQKRTVPI